MNSSGFLRRFLSSEDGLAAVEWAVIVAFIAVVCLVTLVITADPPSGTFTSISTNNCGGS